MTESNTVPQPRRLTDHIVNPCNDKLDIEVLDAPGSGGANHAYVVGGFDADSNPSKRFLDKQATGGNVVLLFQNGPISETGTNGITHEALLAVLIDRFHSFQAGPFACAENDLALKHLCSAQDAMHQRTKARMARGVEGTHRQ